MRGWIGLLSSSRPPTKRALPKELLKFKSVSNVNRRECKKRVGKKKEPDDKGGDVDGEEQKKVK